MLYFSPSCFRSIDLVNFKRKRVASMMQVLRHKICSLLMTSLRTNAEVTSSCLCYDCTSYNPKFVYVNYLVHSVRLKEKQERLSFVACYCVQFLTLLGFTVHP